MIVRIVKMTFRPGAVDDFTLLFEARKQAIKDFPGCSHLQLLQDATHPHVFFTYSTWESTAALGHYRFSEFFKDTWGKTKALFADKPEAWSLNPAG